MSASDTGNTDGVNVNSHNATKVKDRQQPVRADGVSGRCQIVAENAFSKETSSSENEQHENRLPKSKTDEADLINTGGQKWTKVVRKHTRGHRGANAPIVGTLSNDSTNLKTVPRRSCLHVTRLHPQTTVAEIEAFLKDRLQNVACQPLNSKFPEYYSSFKITVDMDEVDKAMDPQLWPRGTYVNRFFQRRTRQTVVE